MERLSLYTLASILFYLEEHPNPSYKLEQYSILPSIAASVLLHAKKDIKDKVVFDLGCGTGRFAIGAALLGAKEVWGVDVDEEALRVAKENEAMVRAEVAFRLSKIKWTCVDVAKLRQRCDTVIQFPPYRRDIFFLKRALSIGKNVYSIHKHEERTLKAIGLACKRAGFELKIKEEFTYYPPWKGTEMEGFKILLVVAKR